MADEQRQEPEKRDQSHIPTLRSRASYFRAAAYVTGPVLIGMSILDHATTQYVVDSVPTLLTACGIGIILPATCYFMSPREPRPREVSHRRRSEDDRPIQPGREGEVVHSEDWADGELYVERIQFGADGSFHRNERYNPPRQTPPQP